jgi:hypothetical protein
MAGKDLKLNLDIATKTAQRDLKDTAKAAVETAEAVESIKTKGQQVADSLAGLADKFEAELGEAEGAADALGNALGSEFKAKLDASGGSVDSMVQSLRSAGLTYDEIKADADALAGSIKRIDDVGSKMDGVAGGARRLSGELDGVNTRGTQGRSVLANMVGNSAQDIGQLGRVAGTAGVALGQMAEYATEGNIPLKQMGALSVGIVAVGFAMNEMAKSAKVAAEIKAFDSERLDGYVKALRGGKSELNAIVETLRESEKIEFTFGGMKSWDIEDSMYRAGVSVEALGKMILGSEEQLNTWAEATRDAGVDAEDVGKILATVGQEKERFTKATEAAEKAETIYGETLKTSKGEMMAYTRVYGEFAEGVKNAEEAVDEQAEAEKRRTDAAALGRGEMMSAVRIYGEYETAMREAMTVEDDGTGSVKERTSAQEILNGVLDERIERERTLRGEALSALDAGYAFEQQQFDLTAALVKYNEAAEVSEQDTRNMAQQIRDAAVDFGTLEGATAESQAATDRTIGSLQGMADSLAPGSPLRLQLERYIADLQRIPSSGTTSLILSSSSGGASTPKGAPIPRAHGGPVSAGESYVVGDGGRPELFVPDQSGTILPRVPTGGNTYVTIITPRMDPNAVIRAQQKYRRRNGS